MSVRSKNLKDEDLLTIVQILDAWSGPLSWNLLIEKLEKSLFSTYTRQTLHKHERVRLAFSRAKHAVQLGEKGPPVQAAGCSELVAVLERLARVESANRRLREENEELLAQFARWAYNAHSRGLDIRFLNQALPSISRGQTQRA